MKIIGLLLHMLLLSVKCECRPLSFSMLDIVWPSGWWSFLKSSDRTNDAIRWLPLFHLLTSLLLSLAKCPYLPPLHKRGPIPSSGWIGADYIGMQWRKFHCIIHAYLVTKMTQYNKRNKYIKKVLVSMTTFNQRMLWIRNVINLRNPITRCPNWPTSERV